MHGFSEHKSKKIIRVNLEYDTKIHKIELSGDFHIHPEESLAKIEQLLTNLEISRIDEISKLINDFNKKHDVELIGITSSDIQQVIKGAIK